jgi:hypothetical protein
MIQGYKATTYTISAHKGLQKTFQIARQEKDTVSEETSSGHICWRLDQLRGCLQAEFQTEWCDVDDWWILMVEGEYDASSGPERNVLFLP